MNSKRFNAKTSNRELIAMIRGRLKEAGRSDVTVSRCWIDEDVEGDAFLLRVPISPELTVPLRPRHDLLETADAKSLALQAGHFATALINLKQAEKMLEKYACDVRRAAMAEISAARRDGLDLLVENVGFKPVYAYQLSDKSWKDAAGHHVFAEVGIRRTSFYLRPESTVVWIDEPSDVAKELKELRHEQRQRQDRLIELERRGYDLEIDSITLDLLDAHGLNAGEVLREAWKKQCLNLRVQDGGREAALSLTTFNGEVKASFELENAYWNGEHLWFTGAEQDRDYKHLIGKSLGDLVRHPVFASRAIVDVFNRHADHIVFDLSDKVLFDADTGRLIREDRLAA